MNKQRRIIKKMCAAGVAGILAANVVTSMPVIKYKDEMETERYHAQAKNADKNDIKKIVVPVTPVTSETAGNFGESEVKGNENQSGSSVTPDRPNHSVVTDNGNAAQRPNGSGGQNNGNVSGKPDGSDNGNVSGKQDVTDNGDGSGSQGVTDSSGVSGKPDGSDNGNVPGKPDSSDNGNVPGKPDSSDNGNVSGKPDDSDNGDGSGKPDGSDNGDGSGKPDDSDNGDGSDNSDDSVNTDNSNNPNNPDNSEQPDQSQGSDDKGDTGNTDGSENPDKPTQSEDSEVSGKPMIPSVPATPEDNSNSSNPSWSLDLKPGLGTNFDNEVIDKLKPEKISPEKIKNASLVLNQKLVKLPKLMEDHRFWTVARKYGFAKEDLIIRESIVSEEDEDDQVRAVGKLRKNGLLYILKEEENGWLYVESGRVRGFVRTKDIVTDEEAGKQLEIYQKKAKDRAERMKKEYTGIEDIAPMAREWLPWQENEAYTYLRATVNQTVVEKKYALAKDKDVEVMEDKKEDSRIIGIIPNGGLCYILEDNEEEWLYVESGDVRGFVKKDSIQYNEKITELVEKKHEDTFPLAEEKIKPEDNKACYYTLTSTKSGVPSGEIRRSIVEFAAQFVGNPYVWGGTSLTEGADCSGFVQSIYKQYGYELPRVSRDQAQFGTKIPVEDALPGDLIFYANNGNVYHVVMYAGDGKTIEAMSTDMGIVQADVSKENAVWATRVLKDNDYEYAGGGISDVNATQDMYGKNLGTFKLTYYCACELCCNIETGITATGAPVVEGRTIAVDPRVIPYGTQVIIGGHVFAAEDCGGAIKEKHIDIYVNDHATALALGVNYADVYLKK